ncbi:ADOP family duplicated permease [Occallatibacter riparius]|uniref:ADOP family duplicated permease n=1 Tax=Occallatibacter riparius TaxID=1002689 RepID=A0A9J7BL45_9BACT|nr:ADOP family duplicated permease [Occallatibacter riparius]UWZ83331.1 ADOP family duplicated permease [Occallatibacter riparius]
MKVFAYLRSIAGKFLRPNEVVDDLEEELASHIAHYADDLERLGMTRAAAERQARVAFGARERFKEESYAALGAHSFEILLRDMRLALRVLSKSKAFAFAAVLTMALAIGANAVVFGIGDALLRPLAVPEVKSLYGTHYGDGSGFQSYPNYVDLRDRNRTFEDLACFNFAFVGFDEGNNPSNSTSFAVSGNYFDVLKVQPYLGRFFHASDEHGQNSAAYIVLSRAFWHSRFHDDRSVIGRVVQVDKHPFTVIGVAPDEFRGTLFFVAPDFYVPIVNQQQVGGGNAFSERANMQGVFEVFGHLRRGVSVRDAEADVNAIGDELQREYPKDVRHQKGSLGQVGLTAFGDAIRAFVAGLALLALLILLAACANLGGLFAAHAADRSREMALRLALGSTRSRVLRQLFTEALLISCAGGAVGLGASIVLLRSLAAWQPFQGAPIHIPITIDARIFVVAVVLALVSGLLFGVVPVRQVMRAHPYEVVKAGWNPLSRRIPVRDALLVLQIAICAVLVTASMVAIRGLLKSLHSNFGFEPRDTQVLGVDLSMGGYSGDNMLLMQRRLVDAMQAIPGVEHAGLVNNYPPLVYTAAFRVNAFKDDTRDLSQSNVAVRPYAYDVSPGYFEAAATSLLAGRSFTWHDDKNAQPVAIANREFAVKMFGTVANAMGRYYRDLHGNRIEIVGVAEDGKYLSLTEDQQPAVFRPFMQSPANLVHVIVRSRSDPVALAAAMRVKLRELDAGLPVNIETWNSLLNVVLFPARVATMALGALGVMGGILSITGIFGMAAYSVNKRLKELGIRIALGAKRREVLGAALGRALRLLAIGSMAGLIFGVLASRVLASIVYQATPRDPIVLGGVIVAMALLGLLAIWIPAQHALSADPLVLLRED